MRYAAEAGKDKMVISKDIKPAPTVAAIGPVTATTREPDCAAHQHGLAVRAAVGDFLRTSALLGHHSPKLGRGWVLRLLATIAAGTDDLDVVLQRLEAAEAASSTKPAREMPTDLPTKTLDVLRLILKNADTGVCYGYVRKALHVAPSDDARVRAALQQLEIVGLLHITDSCSSREAREHYRVVARRRAATPRAARQPVAGFA
jgi:hypothetical protein